MIKQTKKIAMSLLLISLSSTSYGYNDDSTYSNIQNWVDANPSAVENHATKDGACETQTKGIWAKLSMHMDGSYYAEFEDNAGVTEELEKAVVVNGALEVEIQNGRTFRCTN